MEKFKLPPKSILILLFLTTIALKSFGTIYYVSTVNGDDTYAGTNAAPFATIQKAVTTSLSGDEIVVMDGTYYVESPITINSKNLNIHSVNGKYATTIYADNYTDAFLLNNSSGTINGFFISSFANGIVLTNNSSPLIENNYIEPDSDGIVLSNNSAPTIKYNIIDVYYNGINGINYKDNSDVNLTIQNNTITGWYNTGIIYKGLTGTIENNIIYGFNYTFDNANTLMTGFKYNDLYDYWNVTHADISTLQSQHNLVDIGPNFFDTYYYSIYTNSPCYNAGDPALKDSDGTVSDIGAVPFNGKPCNASVISTSVSGNTFNFSPKLSGQGTYNWTIIDNGYYNYIDSTTCSYTFTNKGRQKVSLEVHLPNGIYCNLDTSVFIAGDCQATFTETFNKLTNTVNVDGSTATNVTSMTWDFGDYYGSATTTKASYQYNYFGVYNITQTITASDGCTDWKTYKLVIPDTSCETYFNYNLMDSLQESFQGYSYVTTDTVKSWSWNFGDGSSQASGQNIVHKYNAPGSYNVTLTTKGTYCKSTTTYPLYLQYTCVEPVFSYTNNGTLYSFTVTNPQPGTVYSWYFDDYSNDTTGIKVSHNFENDYSYNVWVTSYDSASDCYNYAYQSIQIGNVGCWADFSSSNDSGNHITFYNYSSIGNYYWDFGDGKNSRLANPNHSYTTSGVYNVCVTVSDSTGCTHTQCYEISAGQVECKANFSYSINSDTAKFKDLSTGTAGVTDFYWDFGDWNGSYEENPTNVYSDPDVYTVYFSMYNETTGCYDETEKDIKVGNASSLTYADFSWYADTSNTVHFSNASSSNITNYYWTFGDGTYKSTKNPSHTYSIGQYNACLTVYSTTDGSSNSKCEAITVGQAVCTAVASYSYLIDTTTVKFTNKSTGDFDTYYWDWGDGGTSSANNPTHTYKNAGFYLVSLAIRSSKTGCADYYANFLQVGQGNCLAQFSYYVDTTNFNVTFKNTSKVTNGLYYWYFDDGGYSTKASPTHKFSEGMHFVSLTVSDGSGLCMDYTEQQVQVGQITCSADFSYYIEISTDSAYCKNKALGKSTQFYWSFGDGGSSEQANPVHKFKYPGYYTIGLNTFDISNSNWCMDYNEQNVLIGSSGIGCKADFAYQVNNTTNTVTFNDNSLGSIKKYLWDFGDGSVPVSSKNTSHKYSGGAGYYDVCLSVVNENNIPNMKCKWVKVTNSGCQSKFIYTVNQATKTVSFYDKSIGNPNSWKWDFGNKTTSTKSANISAQYNSNNFYLVSLQIANDSSCTNKSYQLINIGMPDTISAKFGADAKDYSKKADGYPVDFTGAGVGDHARLRWSFGDSTIDSTSNTPTHIYEIAGTYYVCLTYYDPIAKDSAMECDSVPTTGAINAINTVSTFADFNVYPNPVTDKLVISYNLGGNSLAEVSIYDMIGQKVANISSMSFNTGQKQITYDASALAAGSYIVQLKTSTGLVRKQLIIKK